MEKTDNIPEICLIGGNGFLGKGLQDEMRNHGMRFTSYDKEDFDLLTISLEELIEKIGNFKKIVFLAANVGAKEFESSKARDLATENKRMLEKVLGAFSRNWVLTGNMPDFTYYSSCEIFGSSSSKKIMSNENGTHTLSFLNDRSAYAYQKLEAENYLMTRCWSFLGPVKIIRPFNVSGKHQKRGVLFSMVKSAIEEHVIRYSKDTTRTLTSASFAARQVLEHVKSDESGIYNIFEKDLTMTMETLATIVESYFSDKILDLRLVEMPPDKSIRYRQMGIPDAEIENSYEKMVKIIKEVEDEIRNDNTCLQ